MYCKVCVVDDHALFRRGVVDILKQSNEYDVIAEYASGKAFLTHATELQPELLLLDVQMPGESGIDVLKEIRKTDQQLKVVILTACEDDDLILDAIKSGANGFLPKDTLPEQILSHLQQVRQGQTILHDVGITLLAQQLRHQQTKTVFSPPPVSAPVAMTAVTSDLFEDMTMREKETLLLIAKGLNNKLIARQLGISDGTVKVYVKSLLRKLNVHSRLELSVWAHKNLNISE